MSARVKLCARRFGLLCFPLSAALWAPSAAQAATSFSLSPREANGEQPQEGKEVGEENGEDAVPYNPYEEGQQEGSEAGEDDEKDPAEPGDEVDQDDPDAQEEAGEVPAEDSDDKAAEGVSEVEVQYDEAPPAEGQEDSNATGGDQDAQDDGGVEMEFGEQPSESEGEGGGEQAGAPEGGEEGAGDEGSVEMQFGDESGDPETGAEEGGGVEMQFGDEPSPEADAGSAPEEDEGDGGFVFEDISDDKEALAEELQAGQRQAKGVVGTVRGKITGSDGQEVMGAYVETQDKKYVARAGVDGTFELNLNPGVYTLRVRYDGYEERLFENIEVKAREGVTLDAQITPLPGAVQTMVIEEEVAKEGNVGQAIKRQNATATRDIMSREEMSKSPGSSTSSVARRIVGSTIVGGRYIFVRGLGHRYGNTLLDGARVPSPNPDLRTVPLDIFPTSALSAINVQKTFTPDVPADFAGGSVQLETREMPERFTFKIGASFGGNSRTTFRQQLTSQGASGDAFGLGNSDRGISDDLKNSGNRFRLVQGNVPGTYEGYTPDQLQDIGRSLFLHTLVKTNTHAPMNFGGDLTIGNSWKFGRAGRVGLLFAGGYKNSRQTLQGTQRFFNIKESPEDPTVKVVNPDSLKKDSTTFRSSHSVASNGILIGQIKFDDYHRLDLTGMYARDTDNAIQRNDVLPQGEGFDKVSDRLRYTVRSVAFSQIKGRHEFPRLAKSKVDWFYSYAGAGRDDPAMRQIDYLDFREDVTKPSGLPPDVENGQITTTYLDLEDRTHNAAINATIPFPQWSSLASSFKLGGWAEAKDRKFTVRGIRIQEHSSPTASEGIKNLDGRFEDLVRPEHVDGGTGLDPNAFFFLNENTQPVDNYTATQTQFAGYGLLNLPLNHWLKLSGGVRYEHNLVKVTPKSPFELNQAALDQLEKQKSRLRNSDFFPSLGLTFDVNKKKTMKLRLSGSRTTARPEMRELSSFQFTDFLSGLSIAGYPYLKSTDIWNADLRWEWFLAPGEVLSATVFYKNFKNPIESVIGNTQTLTQASFRNAKGANNVGFELEGKKSFDFIAPWLRPVSAGANFAYVYSRVQLYPKIENCDPRPEDPEFDIARCQLDQAYDGSTSRERPLQDQSPFVLNAFLDLDLKKSGTGARLLYNTFGRRIYQIGGAGVPDVYEESVHNLDLIVEQALYRRPEQIDDEGNILAPARALKLKFAVGNILNYPARFTQQDTYVTRRVIKGANFSLGLSWKM